MGQTDLGRGQGGSDRTDSNSGMGQEEQTLVTLGQTEQTQGQHWARPNRPKIWARGINIHFALLFCYNIFISQKLMFALFSSSK